MKSITLKIKECPLVSITAIQEALKDKDSDLFSKYEDHENDCIQCTIIGAFLDPDRDDEEVQELLDSGVLTIEVSET